ncbi:putative N-acetylmannosaminyltransferase TagA [Clostridium neonatale]|uniref:WecB/TagA/CpsF family glycosyltransferase n=1 Tax=Clostridium neonatale TaxID=137838 RepID=UPI00291B4F53|nr:WecB/TagA/CpsF family glycosyltransferase [Clostridium neonatale]CAI3660093.1 putative N-acetylmannosaminyltransferase TagA [Clostridium neonatale]
MFTKILDFKVFNEDKNSLMKYIEKYEKVNIVSGNPEILLNGMKNSKLKESFNAETSLIIPDGIGTVLASKIVKDPVKEKIAGIDVVKEILIKSEKEKKSIYLLGAEEEVLVKCIENIKKQHPSLNIAGSNNGFFDLNNCKDIIEDIKSKDIYAIFVAMGSPRQEIFIDKILHDSNIKIFMGVGGVFDVFAGKVNRAPKWMISLGLEWLYRTIKEPFRIKRLGAIPKFLIQVVKNRKKCN